MQTYPALTPVSTLIADQRRYFHSGATLPPHVRLKVLHALRAEVLRREPAIVEALRHDLGKNEGEAYITEIGQVLDELRFTIRHLGQWMKERRVPGAPALWPGKSRIHPEPLGVTLIFAPWNYPFQLCLLPLIAAVAAGNCAVLKPSTSAPATAEVLANLIAAVFPPEHVTLVKGDEWETTDAQAHEARSDALSNSPDDHSASSHGGKDDTATALLREHFDFIFYTGSTRVGHIILEAAAKYLTPVCLELGGKSPVIVADDADLALAARRIAWGKSLNAGQTCIAPDYVWVDRRIKDQFVAKLRDAFHEMVGDDPLHNPDYGHIITDKAFQRILSLAQAPVEADPLTRKIAPTVLDALPDDAIMHQEIFGPLLPVLAYDNISEAMDHIRTLPKPLALYLFTSNRALQATVINTLPFGGGCVNDVVVHAGSHHLPFGGVGNSGMGRYHGKAGFELFSNLKSVVRQGTWPDLPMRYPAFTRRHLALLRRFLQ